MRDKEREDEESWIKHRAVLHGKTFLTPGSSY